MAKLIYSLDGAFLGEFSLDKDKLTVGRRSTNDIQIDNLAISGQHAAITTIGNDSFLEDLDSTNGTVVNGKAIKRHVLQHGDVIELGKYQLRYFNEARLQHRKAADAAEKTAGVEGAAVARPVEQIAVADVDVPAAILAPPAITQTPLSRPMPSAAATPVPAGAGGVVPPMERSRLAQVRLLNGPDSGKDMVLSKALTTLGKPGVQVAVITRRPQGYFVTHVEGEQYPMLNGQPAGPQARQLADRDVIEIAGVKMEFFYLES